jgi:N utilization substance protein A
LEEVPGIGEKTVEKISIAVRHYFGHYEEGEVRPVAIVAGGEQVAEAETAASQGEAAQEDSMATDTETKTPEALLAMQAGAGEAEEVATLSTEDLAAIEDLNSASDGFSDADNREAHIELENDATDELVNQSQEVSDEGIDTDGNDRG